MNLPLEITFRDVPKTPEMEDLIREKVDKLEEIFDHISSCRVAIETRQHAQNKGRPYRIRIDITVPPGHEIVVVREPSKGDMHSDLAAEIRDAFLAARRRLTDLKEKQRGDVKAHPEQEARAIVDRLFPGQGTGFLRTLDGRDIFFHRNSVLHDEYDRLDVGTGVWFLEEPGEKGPQASTVRIVDHPHNPKGIGSPPV